MAHTVNVHDPKWDLPRLVASVENGEEMIIARAGRPVARIVAYTEPGNPNRFGSAKDTVSHISLAVWEPSDRDMEHIWDLSDHCIPLSPRDH